MTAEYFTLPAAADKAKQLGVKRFFTGKPCRNGHIAPRLTCSDNPCVVCVKERTSKWANGNPGKVAAYIEANTGHIKKMQAERYLRMRGDILEKVKKHYYENRDLRLAYAKEYRLKNPEVVRARNKAYSQLNSAKKVIYSREWKKNHPDRAWLNSLVGTRRRQAKKLQAMPVWADEARIAEIYRECKRISKQTGIEHHVDHIVPLISKEVCGLHVEQNLRIISAQENLSKGNKHGI